MCSTVYSKLFSCWHSGCMRKFLETNCLWCSFHACTRIDWVNAHCLMSLCMQWKLLHNLRTALVFVFPEAFVVCTSLGLRCLYCLHFIAVLLLSAQKFDYIEYYIVRGEGSPLGIALQPRDIIVGVLRIARKSFSYNLNLNL